MVRRLLGIGLAVFVLASPAGGAERRPQAQSAFEVSTWNLDPDAFKAPWQLAWIADGTDDGAIAFTDRTGNAVGVLDPASGNTQRFPLTNVTSPNGIAPIDFTRFAVAGTGGVVVFDRTGTGRKTELVMQGTRNVVLGVDLQNRLYVPDLQNNDLRIIAPPYGGPADITKFALPGACRGPTGVIPASTTITILCQATNNVVDLSPTGALLRTTALPIANMGAQEARPAPRGAVFSGFNADRLTSWVTDYPDPYDFVSILLNGRGPAVPTVGYFDDPSFQNRIATASRFLGQGRRPPLSTSFNTFVPSFRGEGVSIGTFPNGRTVRAAILAGRNLVGSAVGPGGSLFVADATPGRPAIHRVTPDRFGRTGRNPVRFRYPVTRLTAVDKDFLTRMTFPFSGPGAPGSTPNELQVGIVGSSSSPWHVRRSFVGNFNVRVTGTGLLPGGKTYPLRGRSTDLDAFVRAFRFPIRPGTRSATLTFRGTNRVPLSFRLFAQTPEPEPCRCDSLDVRLRADGGAARPTDSALPLTWTLECTGGAGRCRGTLSIQGDKAARAAGVKIGHGGDLQSTFYPPASKEFDVRCDGDCKAPTTETRYLSVRAPDGSELGKEVKSVTVVVERTCGSRQTTKLYTIAFGAGGVVSARRSDLNGNGVADGKEKR